MNITSMTDGSVRSAGKTLRFPAQKSTAPVAPRHDAFDRIELSYGDVLSAEREGCIEVNGKRFSVSGDMAASLRETYEKMCARNEERMARQMAQQNAQSAREQAEAAKKEGDTMAKAMEIARRIGRGGRVPAQDEKFLLEFSQELYMAAKMQALLAREHEKYDSILEDEEEEEQAGEDVGEPGAGAEHLEASVSDGAVESVSTAAGEE